MPASTITGRSPRWTPDEVAKVDSDLKLNGRIDRDSWVFAGRGFVEAAAAV